MRFALVVLIAVFAAAEEPTPVFRCRPAAPVTKLPRVTETGDAWLDKRIASEVRFLQRLFNVKPELVLLADSAERDVFVMDNVIAFKATWLVRHCSKRKEHRTARVAYALAHQYAHVVQDKLGCRLPEMSREKQADLLAGWYLGRRNIATLKEGAKPAAELARLVFWLPDPFLNERFEHGHPKARLAALVEGFKLARRKKKASLQEAYEWGIKLFPPPKVGVYGGAADARVSPILAAGLKRMKVECKHKGPCNHKVDCTHQKPCVHKVPCKHFVECTHRVPCIHRVACTHEVQCVHRVECTHKVPCVHWIPCTHFKHEWDYLHEFDRDVNGNRVPCIHRIKCTHTLHRVDFLHNFDLAHEFDYAHEFDLQHEFDLAHESDPQHPEGDPQHEFDFAHEWDPVHPFDLAHEWDPVHDYDVRDE